LKSVFDLHSHIKPLFNLNCDNESGLALHDLGERLPGLPLLRVIGDVKDLPHLRRSFGAWRPQQVFHAAALEPVPPPMR